MNLRATFFLLFCLLALPNAGRAEVTLTGSQGALRSDFSDSGLARTLWQEVELSYQRSLSFLQEIGFRGRLEVPLNVRIFADLAAMQAAMPGQIAKEVHVNGYFGHKNREIGVWYSGDLEETKRILRHEVVHHVLHGVYGTTPPAWLDEGLAELLSRNPVTSGANLTLSSETRAVLQAARESAELPSLRHLLSLDHDTFYGAKQDIHYATACAFLAFILEKEGHRVLGNLASHGTDPLPFIEGKLGMNPDATQSPWLDRLMPR